MACTCCIGCTIVNYTECDPETEKLITLDIHAGNAINNFKWELKEASTITDTIIAAGGEYDDGELLNIQLCLSSSRWNFIATSAAVTTPPPTRLPTYTPTVTRSTVTPYPAYYLATPYPTAINPLSPCIGNASDWVDGNGNGCNWYEVNDMLACSRFGSGNDGDMGLAKDNCCYCTSTEVIELSNIH